MLVFWARHQLGQANPLIDLRLLGHRRIATAYFCMAMVGMGMTQHTLIMTMLLQQPARMMVGFGLGAAAAAALLAPVRLVGVVASPLAGLLASRYGPRAALLTGCAAALAGWGLIFGFSGDIRAVVVMVLEGAGYAIAYVAVPVILLDAAPPERAGEVTGLSSVFRAAFSAAGAQIVMLLLDAAAVVAPEGTRLPGASSYRLGIGFIIAASALCAIGAWSLRRDRPAPAAA